MSTTVLGHCFAAPPDPFTAGSVVVREGAGVVAFRGTPPPAGVGDLFRRIADVVYVGGLPLAWLETAGGRGGFFRGDLVAVGEEDVRRLTSTVIAGLPSIQGAWVRAQEVYGAVVRVLLAHEIGHAVQAKLGIDRRGPAAEQGADLTAGWIAEALGWPAWGDAIVLSAVGDPGAGSHPSPSARVAAYREGRRMRRARVAA